MLRMSESRTWPKALIATELARVPEVCALLMCLRERAGLVALDSASGEPQRMSLVAFQPRREICGREFSLADLRLWCSAGPEVEHLPGPFRGGFIGALSYDLGVSQEQLELPDDPWRSPRLLGGLYAEFFVIDHVQSRAWLVTGDDLEVDEREALLVMAGAATRAVGSMSDFELEGEVRRLVPRELHMERVEAARELIARGEIYQANIAHPFEAATRGDPLELYLSLRESNPAPYMAYLRMGAWALLSSSPELLLEVRGRSALTRPIKGTVCRSEERIEDQRLAEELLASSKDRAELAMIVDLERNDLGRVARTGSVRVGEFPALRSYANVHHLTADVSCELAAGKDGIDALEALFPGGSITGAPKLRSMEAIASLEGEGRGFFTGALGFVSYGGDLCFNILIRSLVWRAEPERGALAGRVRYHVGGGITWGSEAASEDEETLAKGARLAMALHRKQGEAVS